MDLVNSYPTPPPYSRLDEENHQQNHSSGLPEPEALSPKPPTDNDYPLTEAKKEESRVTINFGDSPPSKLHQQPYRFVLKSFLCGCSLRAGCITVAVLYSLYLVFFAAIAISFFIITYVENETETFSSIWGFNVALFECCMASFIIVFISLGIHKRKACRLHVAKWLMIVDLCLNLLEEIQIALLINVYGLFIHLIMQVVPLYFIFVVHSYEAQMRMDSLKNEISRSEADTFPSNN